MNKICKADLKRVRVTSITITSFFNLMSPWFSYIPVPKTCLLRCPRTGAGQSSSQNMSFSMLSPETITQANHKNSYCVLPLYRLDRTKNEKAATFSFERTSDVGGVF